MSQLLHENTRDLERRLQELTGEIRQHESDAAEAQEKMKARLHELREQDVDWTQGGAAFEEIDRLGLAYDTPREEAATKRAQAEGIMRQLGRMKGSATGLPGVGGISSLHALANRIIETPHYQALIAANALEGSGRIEIPGIELAAAEDVVRALRDNTPLFHQIDGGPLVTPQYLPTPIPIAVPPVRIINLINSSTTESNLIHYIEETTRTDAAAITPLGTAYNEADYEYTLRSAAVKDIGHWVAAHRSNLADAGQLQALLEGRLENGVQRALETQIVQGNGIGNNMLGILNTPNVNAINRDGTNAEHRLEAVHRGITAIRITSFTEPDAIAAHPTNYEQMVFEKGSDGQYLLGPAFASTSRTIWGFPAAITVSVPLNTVLPGNFALGGQLWVRSGVTTRISDSHQDFFTKRMVAILAEMRAAFAAWVPRAFAAVDVT